VNADPNNWISPEMRERIMRDMNDLEKLRELEENAHEMAVRLWKQMKDEDSFSE
jgi:hypothetical protein